MLRYLFPIIFLFPSSILAQNRLPLHNQKIDGYRGIWFELNQKYAYGDKYSGGLGTYTAKHIPLAIYAPEVDKTFFVYGGTTHEKERHLLAMIGLFDHQTGKVSKPTVVYDKISVDDPHDNPSLMIDDAGFIHVFVSGRANSRKGIKLISAQPYSIDSFKIVSEEIFAYPQIWNVNQGYFHFFTKYTGTREIYYETSLDGNSWSEDKKLAGIRETRDERSGHYQVSNHFNNGAIIGTFMNRHRNGHPDTRTDLYYVQTKDFGRTWQDIRGNISTLPLTHVAITERVVDYHSKQKNVYLKDTGYDGKGHPVCLYLTSEGHEPGPYNSPYAWTVTHWNGKAWITNQVCTSDHNYDMGSLYITDSLWTVVGPTETGPQFYGVGGEIAIWTSVDEGETWIKDRTVTKNSPLNHAYVRRPLEYASPFCYFWASGHPHRFGKSELYFGDFEGNVWKLPYRMDSEFEKPQKLTYPR